MANGVRTIHTECPGCGTIITLTQVLGITDNGEGEQGHWTPDTEELDCPYCKDPTLQTTTDQPKEEEWERVDREADTTALIRLSVFLNEIDERTHRSSVDSVIALVKKLRNHQGLCPDCFKKRVPGSQYWCARCGRYV